MKSRNTEIGKDEVTIIGTGVVLEGKLISNGNVRVDGTINGDINANGNVTIGENGEVNGELNAENITIGGKVIGTINSKEKLTLETKCVLKGDIITKILVIEAGAKFDGNTNMSQREVTPRPPMPPTNQ